MPLTLRTNGSGGSNIVSSSWWNDYYNLLTGVMTDQQVTIKFTPATLGGVPLLVSGNNNCDVVFEVDNSGAPLFMVGPDASVWMGGGFTSIGGRGTYTGYGGVGIPLINGAWSNTHVTVTTDNFLGWNPTAAGLFRVAGTIDVNNGGAATITAYVKYKHRYSGAIVTEYLKVLSGTTVVVLNAASLANGQYNVVPHCFMVNPSGQNVEVHYQDSTNTPSDYFDYVLEWLL